VGKILTTELSLQEGKIPATKFVSMSLLSRGYPNRGAILPGLLEGEIPVAELRPRVIGMFVGRFLVTFECGSSVSGDVDQGIDIAVKMHTQAYDDTYTKITDAI